MSVTSRLNADAGAGNSRYVATVRDFANARRWNKTAGTWKSSVAIGDATIALAERGAPYSGAFYNTTTGMGAPGVCHRYYHDTGDSNFVIAAERVAISDGSYGNSPDAAVRTNAAKLRLELIADHASQGNSRFKARLVDREAGQTWNNAAGAWQSSVSDSDSLVSLSQEAASEYANVYAAFVDVGSRTDIEVSYYDATDNPDLDEPVVVEVLEASSEVSQPGSQPYKIEAMQAHGVNTVVTKLNPTRESVLVLYADPLSAPCLMMRIVDAVGTPISPAAITSATYSIYQRSDSDLALNNHIDGHYRKALTVADVVLSSLQNDYLWDEADDEGYNFRHQLDVATYEALSEYGSRYDIVYDFRPANGQKFPARYMVRT